jgi:hypothetical protein
MPSGHVPLIAKPEWTADEEQRLRVQLISGVPPTAIGKQLNRSEGAVRLRMKKLGLPAGRVKVRSLAGERTQALRNAASAGGIEMKAKGK